MIAAVRGTILEKEPGWCDVMTASGVAYRLFTSLTTFGSLGKNEVLLYTTPVYREDAQALYGFADRAEQKMFEMLLKINGVGPKVAMAILSTFSPTQFARVIQGQDIPSLCKVPGIGKKSAGLILVQLGEFSVEMLGQSDDPLALAKHEAAQALEGLGFKKELVTQVLSQCAATDTAGLVKEALQKFQK